MRPNGRRWERFSSDCVRRYTDCRWIPEGSEILALADEGARYALVVCVDDVWHYQTTPTQGEEAWTTWLPTPKGMAFRQVLRFVEVVQRIR